VKNIYKVTLLLVKEEVSDSDSQDVYDSKVIASSSRSSDDYASAELLYHRLVGESQKKK
jgi:hypothetical protein